MQSVIRIAIGIVAGTLMLVGGVGSSLAQPTITSKRVSFDAATARGGGAHVRGMLRIPETGATRLPAVLVLHTSAGAYNDVHSDAFIEVLNRAGLATLWIEMFRDKAARPRSTREVLPLTFGSLLYLATQPRIDPQRIGVIGFSYGGVVTLIMASQEVTQEYTGGKARFAAHLALYPVCWVQLQILSGENSVYGASTYMHVTGAPVHILAGEKDDYDEPDSCPKFVAALPEDVRSHFAATVYPGAYHSFDGAGVSAQSYDRYAHLGHGGTVTLEYNPAAAAQARAFAVEFFSKNLKVTE
jgi:dienelactone hydrolase